MCLRAGNDVILMGWLGSDWSDIIFDAAGTDYSLFVALVTYHAVNCGVWHDDF